MEDVPFSIVTLARLTTILVEVQILSKTGGRSGTSNTVLSECLTLFEQIVSALGSIQPTRMSFPTLGLVAKQKALELISRRGYHRIWSIVNDGEHG